MQSWTSRIARRCQDCEIKFCWEKLPHCVQVMKWDIPVPLQAGTHCLRVAFSCRHDSALLCQTSALKWAAGEGLTETDRGRGHTERERGGEELWKPLVVAGCPYYGTSRETHYRPVGSRIWERMDKSLPRRLSSGSLLLRSLFQIIRQFDWREWKSMFGFLLFIRTDAEGRGECVVENERGESSASWFLFGLVVRVGSVLQRL